MANKKGRSLIMITLKMNNELFEVITEDINSLYSDVMCGNAKGEPEIYRKDFFGRVLPTIKITLEMDGAYPLILKYTMKLSDEDFITLYNEIIWGAYESYGAIKYDWFRVNTKELCTYLIKIKEENNLKSTLDDVENLLWFMDEEEEDSGEIPF